MQQRDDHDTFVRALETHKGILYKVANAYGAGHDRSDLAQDIVVELWRAYPGYDAARAKFATWMYRIALNVAISHRRGRHGADTLSLDAAGLDFEAADRELASGSADLHALHQLLATLDPVSRALVLLYLEGHAQDEIAAMTGLTETNVTTRIHRIKQRLRLQAGAENSP
jgi:RNA polymerase sigma factor (sigma-70 family)